MIDRPANWKRWILLAVAYIIGAIVGGSFVVQRFSSGWDRVPWPIQWLLMPGILFLAPAWVLTGGVHGDQADSLFQLVPWANGLAYALVAAGIRRVMRLRRGSRAESPAE